MAGYLEGYGAGDAKRERKVKIIVISVLSFAITSGILYATFRDFSQESKIKDFLAAVERKDFAAAYTFWGCTKDVPCRDYSYEKFLEDWGPTGENFPLVSQGIYESERCGSGFLAALHPGSQEVSLWVERSTGLISYAPWMNCPERKLRLMKWLKMRFGKS
jgi:hypothetical protein